MIADPQKPLLAAGLSILLANGNGTEIGVNRGVGKVTGPGIGAVRVRDAAAKHEICGLRLGSKIKTPPLGISIAPLP